MSSSDTHHGYQVNVFSGKQEQQKLVAADILEKGFIPEKLIESEVQWFYGNLGIDDIYFQLESHSTIAQHVMALYSSKVFAFVKNQVSFLYSRTR